MRVRYRLVEKWFRWGGRSEWVPWGIVYENRSPEFQDRPLLFYTILDDDRRTARHLDARTRTLKPTIEEAERLIDPEWPVRFRVLPDIHVVEGSTYQQVRRRLWERLFEALGAGASPGATPRWKYPLPQPAYHALREGDKTEVR